MKTDDIRPKMLKKKEEEGNNQNDPSSPQSSRGSRHYYNAWEWAAWGHMEN
jgi:hypothetical protein